jgi:tetratricopeptide (TPR) repeat protein
MVKWELKEDVDKFANELRAIEIYNKGQQLLLTGKIVEAIECFDQALELNPRDTNPWIGKGAALAGQMKFDDALDCIDKAISINPDDGRAWHAKATTLLFANRIIESDACLKKSAALGYAEAIEALGQEQVKGEQQAPSKKTTAQSEKVKELTAQGISYTQQKEYDEAVTCFDQALKLDPENIGILILKGKVLADQYKPESASQTFDEAISLDPENPYIWDAKGFALCRTLVKLDEGLACIDKAIAINPNFADAWYHKGTILRITKDIRKDKGEGAQECLKKAASLGHPDAIKETQHKFLFFKR